MISNKAALLLLPFLSLSAAAWAEPAVDAPENSAPVAEVAEINKASARALDAAADNTESMKFPEQESLPIITPVEFTGGTAISESTPESVPGTISDTSVVGSPTEVIQAADPVSGTENISATQPAATSPTEAVTSNAFISATEAISASLPGEDPITGMLPAVQGASETLTGLDIAVSSALMTNEQLGMASQQVRQARYVLKEAQASYMPKLNIFFKAGRNAANPSGARQEDDPRGSSEYVNGSTAKLELNQMLFDGYRTPAEVKRQRNLMRAAQQRQRTVANEVQKDSIGMYLTAWRHMQATEAGVDLVTGLMELKRRTDLQAKLGAADETTRSYVDSRLTRAQQQLLQVKNAYTDALHRLEFLTRRKYNPETYAFPALTAPALQPLETYQALVLDKNPDILEARFNEAAALADLRKERADLFPSLSLVGDLTDNNDIGGSMGNVRTGSLMVQAQYKLFDGFSSKNRQKRARSAIEEQRLNLSGKTRTYSEDIAQLYRRIKALENEYFLAMQEATSNMNVEKLRRSDVENGDGDMVRLIEAKEATYVSRVKLAELAGGIAERRYEISIMSGLLDDASCLAGNCTSLPIETLHTLDLAAVYDILEEKTSLAYSPADDLSFGLIEPAAGDGNQNSE